MNLVCCRLRDPQPLMCRALSQSLSRCSAQTGQFQFSYQPLSLCHVFTVMSFSFLPHFLLEKCKKKNNCEANAPRSEIQCDNAKSYFFSKNGKGFNTRAGGERRNNRENKGTKWNISWRISFMLKRMNIMCMYKLCGVESDWLASRRRYCWIVKREEKKLRFCDLTNFEFSHGSRSFTSAWPAFFSQ